MIEKFIKKFLKLIKVVLKTADNKIRKHGRTEYPKKEKKGECSTMLYTVCGSYTLNDLLRVGGLEAWALLQLLRSEWMHVLTKTPMGILEVTPEEIARVTFLSEERIKDIIDNVPQEIMSHSFSNGVYLIAF